MLINKIGKYLFNIGIFFSVSAPILSVIPIFISSIIGSLKREEKFLNDKYIMFFIAGTFFMVINCLISKDSSFGISESGEILSWIGLLNWIPFFWIFWAIQPYLSSKDDREMVGLSLICSTIPVLVSGFNQSILNLYGPFQTLGGLVIWYQRNHGPAVSSLFSNQNYAGTWLALILPFSIFFLIKKQQPKILRILAFLITSSIISMILLTNSRASLSSIIISSSLLFSSKIIINNYLIYFILIIAIFLFFSSFFSTTIREVIEFLIPSQLIDKFLATPYDPRIEIWSKAIKFIKMNPIFGYGAGTFPLIYAIYGGTNDGQHTHNLFLQLSFDYGVLAALLIFIPFCIILINSTKINYFRNSKVNNDENISNKIWLYSLLIFFIIHSFDITYYDGRISFFFWLLLSGNYCINKEFLKK